MSKVEYSACHDLPATIKGDTIDSFRVTLDDVETIESVKLTLCRQATKDKKELETTIDGNAVIVHAINTSSLYAGLYTYTMRFKISGRERTYLAGKLNIIESCKVC